MYKFLTSIFLLGISSILNANGQLVELKQDTVTAAIIYKVNIDQKRIVLSEKFLITNGQIYHGDNIPFDCLMCTSPKVKSRLFYTNFDSITDNKNIEKLLQALYRQKSSKLNSSMIDNDLKFLIHGLSENSCLVMGNFDSYRIAKIKFIASYFLTDCERSETRHSDLFCNANIIDKRIPIILKIEEFFDN